MYAKSGIAEKHNSTQANRAAQIFTIKNSVHTVYYAKSYFQK